MDSMGFLAEVKAIDFLSCWKQRQQLAQVQQAAHAAVLWEG